MTAPRPIGALRHRVALERAAPAADGTLVWTAFATVFAAIDPTSASEAEIGGGTGGRVSHRLEIRFRADVDAGVRARLGTRIFRILAAHDLDETRRRLVIRAEEEPR